MRNSRLGRDMFANLHLPFSLAAMALRFLWLMLQPKATLVARCLVLEKQIANTMERGKLSNRVRHHVRAALALLNRFFDVKNSIVIVKPRTLVKWHRAGFSLYWRFRSRPLGRPPLALVIRALIRQIAAENPTWGEERIVNELGLKLGFDVDSRTVRKYMRGVRPRRTRGATDQRWLTFIHNHAKVIVASDLFTVVTAGLRVLHVMVIMEIGSRKILRTSVTAHPTAEWISNQFREAIPCDHEYRFVIHDRDGAYSPNVDRMLKGFGLRVLLTPPRTPQANAFRERLIGSIRRECLDYMIPLGEKHLRLILREWVDHYNHTRPHMSLGPGFPDPPQGLPASMLEPGNFPPDGYEIESIPILGGLHHDYRLKRRAA